MLRIPPILGGVGSRNGMPSIANRFANAKFPGETPSPVRTPNSYPPNFVHFQLLHNQLIKSPPETRSAKWAIHNQPYYNRRPYDLRFRTSLSSFPMEPRPFKYPR